jgi:hypothetical protein
LSFSISKPFNWLGYSLDGQQNVTVNGNTTIPDVAFGSHSITVYANNTYGVLGSSQTTNFSIVKPEAFPTLTIAIVSASAVVVVVASLLVYHKKHKQHAL